MDLFNAGYYWESHAAWERLWQVATSEETRTFLQGLIQLAASWVQLGLGHPKGAQKLRSRGLSKLGRFARPTFGIDVPELVKRVESGGPPQIELEL